MNVDNKGNIYDMCVCTIGYCVKIRRRFLCTQGLVVVMKIFNLEQPQHGNSSTTDGANISGVPYCPSLCFIEVAQK